MKKIFRLLALALALIMACMCFVGCDGTYSGSEQDTAETLKTASTLQENQPTPTDLEYSLERYNLIRRAYWVNGQREKANALVCEVVKPFGYVVLITDNGAVVGQFIVDGKVSSLNSYLTPDSEVYEIEGESSDMSVYNNGTRDNDWIADVDGSYGENDNGIFFFTPSGNYIEWTGTYIYSDIPFEIDNPIVTVKAE